MTTLELIEKAKSLIGTKQIGVCDHYDFLEKLANEFGIYEWVDDPNSRLVSVYVQMWYCTDTYVGKAVHFIDGEAVAISTQSGRKSSVYFKFLNEESAKKTKKYIDDLRTDNMPDLTYLTAEEVSEDLGSSYKVEYTSQILHKTAYFNGVKVSIKDKNVDNDYCSRMVQIGYENGNTEILDCRSLDFRYGEF